MRRATTKRIVVSPGGGKGKGEATPVEFAPSPKKGECLRIRVDSHFDEGQTASMAWMMLTLLSPQMVVRVIGEALLIPGVKALIDSMPKDPPETDFQEAP